MKFGSRPSPVVGNPTYGVLSVLRVHRSLVLRLLRVREVAAVKADFDWLAVVLAGLAVTFALIGLSQNWHHDDTK